MKARTAILIGLALLLTPLFHLEAQIPGTLSYQAFLSDSLGVPKADGTYIITFGLYGVETGGTALWTETKDDLYVKQGLFYTHLGPFPASLRFDQPYWLGIQVGEELELTPRIPLTSVGYSFMALRSDSAQYALLADSAQFATRADTAKVAKSALAAADLADDAVTSAKIQDGTIGTVDLADNAVTPAKIDTTGAATGQVLVYSGTSVAWQPPPISSGDITAVELADNAVTMLKLADNAVTSEKIADGTIQRGDVAASFTAPYADTSDYADTSYYALSAPPSGSASGDLTGTYPNPAIAANAVNSEKISDGTITGSDISTSADVNIASLSLSSDASVVGNLTASALDVTGTVTAASLATSGGASVGGSLTASALDVNGTVHVGGLFTTDGGHIVKVVTIEDEFYAATPSDRIILGIYTGGDSQTSVTLPTATSAEGLVLTIKNISQCCEKNVSITPAEGEEIDGSGAGMSMNLWEGYGVTIVSDGSAWWTISMTQTAR